MKYLLSLFLVFLFSCKSIEVSLPIQGEIELNPFCVAAVTPLEAGEHYDIEIFCKDGYSFKDQKAYGEFQKQYGVLDGLIEHGFIVISREQFQKLVADLVEAGLVEVN